MKKTFGRILAIMLAMALMVGFVPTAFATEGDEALSPSGVKVVYDLTVNGVVDESNKEVISSQTFLSTNGFWAADKMPTIGGNFNFAKSTAAGIQVSIAAGSWWAIKVNVPKAGDYQLKINQIYYKYGGQGEIYFGKSTGDSNCAQSIVSDSNAKIGNIGFYAATQSRQQEIPVGKVEVPESGEYIIVIKATAKGDGTSATNTSSYYARQYFNKLILDGCETGTSVPAVMGSVSLDEKETIKATESAELSVVAYDGISGAALTLPEDITFETSDSSILSVEGTVATAHRAGEVKISASSASWANSIEKKITVDPAMDYSDVRIVYSMDVSTIPNNGLIDDATFVDTKNFWSYETKDGNPTLQRNNVYGVIVYPNANTWWAIRMYVPKAGSYKFKLERGMRNSGGLAYFSFGKASEGADAIAEKERFALEKFYADTDVTSTETASLGIIEVEEAGEYILVIKTPSANDFKQEGMDASKRRHFIKKIILDGGNSFVPMLGISASADEIIVGETTTVTATAALLSDSTTAADATISYAVESDDATVASVDANGVVTGLSEGSATIIATATQNGLSSSKSIEITVTAPEDENAGELIEDTDVSIAVMPGNVAGGSVSGVENVVGEVEIGSKITVTATPNEGYKFAYWKNSSGKVLSVNETETFTVNTNTAITAVFDKISDASADTFGVYLYNANGMPFFVNENVSANTLFYDAIAEAREPKLAGYEFSHWSKTEDAAKIAEDAVVSGVTRATAVYSDSSERYTVKVNGNVVASEKKYGESVTVTSDDNDFSCWKLGDKVISYEKSYTFFVWGNVELTEVKNGEVEAVPVAVLSKSGNNCHLTYSVPAGYKKIEAGIIFGSGSGINVGSTDGYKVSETLGTGQLTVSSDYEYARGYIIFKNPENEIRVVYAD